MTDETEYVEWEKGRDWNPDTRLFSYWIRHNRDGCRRKSFHSEDIDERYCGVCHGFGTEYRPSYREVMEDEAGPKE